MMYHVQCTSSIIIIHLNQSSKSLTLPPERSWSANTTATTAPNEKSLFGSVILPVSYGTRYQETKRALSLPTYKKLLRDYMVDHCVVGGSPIQRSDLQLSATVVVMSQYVETQFLTVSSTTSRFLRREARQRPLPKAGLETGEGGLLWCHYTVLQCSLNTPKGVQKKNQCKKPQFLFEQLMTGSPMKNLSSKSMRRCFSEHRWLGPNTTVTTVG